MLVGSPDVQPVLQQLVALRRAIKAVQEHSLSVGLLWSSSPVAAATRQAVKEGVILILMRSVCCAIFLD